MNDFAGFVDAGPAAAPPPQQPSDAFAGFVDAGPSTKSRPPVSQRRAVFEGALDTAGFGFRDEVLALSKASGLPEILGGLRAPVGAYKLWSENRRTSQGENQGGLTGLITGDQRGPAHKTYDEALDEIRKVQGEAEQQWPNTYMGGQIGGALIAPGLGAARAGTLGGRALQSAKIGAISGGAYGIGSGEDTTDRAIRGATGAAVGGLTGAALAPVTDAAIWGASKVGQSAKSVYDSIRAELRPGFLEDEASRRIMSAQTADVTARGRPAWSPGEVAAANEAGIPRAIVDAGDENTLALARASANQSPEARQQLTDLAQERFAGQADRAARFVTGLTGTRAGQAVETLEELQARSRALNAPAYERAYQAGDRPIWSPEMERLSGSTAVQQAMRSAVTTSNDRSIEMGFGAFNPGVTVTPDGRLLMGQTMRGGAVRGTPTYPNLQYWDAVQRDLADMVEKVQGREPDKARYLNSIHQQLNSELDRLVPEFQRARIGAWQQFQARDALEAGRNFVFARGENAEYGRAIAGMNPADRELFAHGFASTLIDRIRELGDNQSILKQAFLGARGGGSDAARQRIEMALGRERAGQIEVYLRAETLADRLRGALGNSTTARQLAEMGLAGAGGAVVAHGLSTDEVDRGHLIGAALLLGSAYGKHRAQVFEKTLATRIGTMLASNDPAVMRRGAEIVARSEKLMGALRRAGDVIGKKFNQRATARVISERPAQGVADFFDGN